MPDRAQSLIVDLAGRRFAVPAERVVRVGYAGAVSALPFARPPVDGLATLDETPVTQIDTAGALGLAPGGGAKLVVVRFDQGRLALRLDAVIGVAAAGPDEPPLPMERILQHFPADGGVPADVAAPSKAAAAEETAGLLLVEIGGETVALLAAGVDRVVEVEAVRRLDGDGGAPAHIAIVDGQPLATLPLGSGRAAEPAAAGWGVVGRGEGAAAVLLVDRVLELRRVPLWRLGQIPGAGPRPRLCVSLEDGRVVALHDLAALSGAGPAPAAAAVRARPAPARADQRASGLRVRCAGTDLVIPLTLIARVGRGDDLPPAGGRTAVPVFDGARLLNGAGTGNSAIVVARGGRYGAFLVDRSALDAGTPPWQPAPWLPTGAAALFDAVRPDSVTGGWVLRLREQPAALTWTVRRAMVAARSGWTALDPATFHHPATP